MEWDNLFILETRAYIWEAGFKPIIGLLLERSASATMVQCLIERWWDTTHTFHITECEITMIPYDFYRMIGLSFKGAIINLGGVLGRKYSIETIYYFDLVSGYMLLPLKNIFQPG